MASQKRLFAYTLVQLPAWEFLSGEVVTLDGVNRQEATVPSRASIVEIRAESGEVYFNINGLASENSGGYIPEDQAEVIGPLANLNSLSLFSTTLGTDAHLMYFVEV